MSDRSTVQILQFAWFFLGLAIWAVMLWELVLRSFSGSFLGCCLLIVPMHVLTVLMLVRLAVRGKGTPSDPARLLIFLTVTFVEVAVAAAGVAVALFAFKHFM
jgi:hypothetical protein